MGCEYFKSVALVTNVTLTMEQESQVYNCAK